MSPRPHAALPLAAALVTMVLWASAFIAIRAVGAHYSPGAMAAGRLAVGAAALSAVAAFRQGFGLRAARRHSGPNPSRRQRFGLRAARRHSGPNPSRRQRFGLRAARRHSGPNPSRRPVRLPRGRPLLLVLAYGAAWFGVYAVAINAAERHLDAGTTALIINLGPILIAVLAGLYLREGFPRFLMIGLSIAFLGVVTIAIGTSAGQRDMLGVLLALAAAALYAIGVVLQKQALRDVDPFTATWLGCLTGAVVCLPFAPALINELSAAPAAATAGIVYMGLFPTAIAFATWSYALAHTSAGQLSSSSYLVPGLAVLMSWLLLNEVPTPLALVGGALCLVGVAVTRLPARSKPPSPSAPYRDTLHSGATGR
jgi:drug/metabolite transporter (DMT)-like permease